MITLVRQQLRAILSAPAVAIVGQFLQTFNEYLPSQVSGTLSVEQALRALEAGAGGN